MTALGMNPILRTEPGMIAHGMTALGMIAPGMNPILRTEPGMIAHGMTALGMIAPGMNPILRTEPGMIALRTIAPSIPAILQTVRLTNPILIILTILMLLIFSALFPVLRA